MQMFYNLTSHIKGSWFFPCSPTPVTVGLYFFHSSGIKWHLVVVLICISSKTKEMCSIDSLFSNGCLWVIYYTQNSKEDQWTKQLKLFLAPLFLLGRQTIYRTVTSVKGEMERTCREKREWSRKGTYKILQGWDLRDGSQKDPTE